MAKAASAFYLAFVFAMFTAYWGWQQDDWASALGYEIGTALIPAVIVLLWYRKKPAISSARKVSVLASWIFVVNLISIGGNKPHLTTSDLPNIAREAAGLAPIANPDDTGRTALREYFKELIDQNKGYQSKIATLKSENLYTPESYLDVATAKQIIAQFQEIIQIEDAQSTALDAIETRCEARINALDWSEGEKRRFIKGFEAKVQEKRAFRRALLSSEKEWVNSISDLYGFVLDNERYFGRSGTDVVIANSNVLNEFNTKIRHANELREKYQKQLKEFDQAQTQNSKALGISAHDLGLSQ